MAQGFGTRDRPANLDPFQLIVEVGWATGGVVVAELEFCRSVQGLDINVLSPDENLGEVFMQKNRPGLTQVLSDDYKLDDTWYASAVGDAFVIEDHIITEDEVHPWIWDAFLINALGDTTGVDAAVTSLGPFDFHFEGMQIAYDTVHLGRPLLGDYVTYTHPNGHIVTFAQGATPLSVAYIQWHSPTGGGDFTGVVIRPSDANGIPPLQDLAGTESWYWYHEHTVPAHETQKIRQAWLVYFASDRTHSAEISNDVSSSITELMRYNLRGYPAGTEFDISSEGHITPKIVAGIVPPPIWEMTENADPAIAGQLKRFGPKGIVV